jgi:hypothetical protein
MIGTLMGNLAWVPDAGTKASHDERRRDMKHRTLGMGWRILALTASALFLVTSFALACDSEKSASAAVAKAEKAEKSCCAVGKSAMKTAAVTPAIAPHAGKVDCSEAEIAVAKNAEECAYMKAALAADGKHCESMDPATCAAMKAAGYKCPEGMSTSARTASVKADHCKEGGVCPYSGKKISGASVDKAPAKKVSKNG